MPVLSLLSRAGIGLVLVAASETVARARDRQRGVAPELVEASPAPAQPLAPVTLPTPVPATPVIDATE